jgi:RNA-directed DNA polymerase
LKPIATVFAPLRSCYDAKEAIFTAINRKPKFVFDADIKGAFDHIKQEALLEKLHTYPTLKKAVHWGSKPTSDRAKKP